MNTNAINLAAQPAVAFAAPLQIVLAYDHPAMANAARALLNSLLARSASDVDIHRDEWSFAELEHPQCRPESLELARDCDLFVISVASVNEIPQSFIEWLNDWFNLRVHKETALVLCALKSDPSTPFPHDRVLADLAGANNLTFLSTTIALPEAVQSTLLRPKSWLAQMRSINPNMLPEFSGINE